MGLKDVRILEDEQHKKIVPLYLFHFFVDIKTTN